MLSIVFRVGEIPVQDLVFFVLVLHVLLIPGISTLLFIKYVRRDNSADDERIEELEREVEELRNERKRAPEEPDDKLE